MLYSQRPKPMEYPLNPLEGRGVILPNKFWEKATLEKLVIQDGIFIEWQQMLFNNHKHMAGFKIVSMNGPIQNMEVIESLANTRLKTHPIFDGAKFSN